MSSAFNYPSAFTRNIGILTKEEQERVQQTHVALAGMGGVGGEYLISLVRMGFQNFRICDLDEFELQNFNRQFGANISSINKSKTETMRQIALEINPNCRIEIVNEPIQEDNVEAFIQNTDLVIDGIDFFQLDAHRILIDQAQSQGIPVLAAVPLGFGSGIINFGPSSPAFDEFFDLKSAKSPSEEALLFALGFGIGAFHVGYISQYSIDLQKGRGPSIISGIKAAVGAITAASLQVLLWPEEVSYAPSVTHLDFRKRKSVSKKLYWGNRGWFQRLKFSLAKKRFCKTA